MWVCEKSRIKNGFKISKVSKLKDGAVITWDGEGDWKLYRFDGASVVLTGSASEVLNGHAC